MQADRLLLLPLLLLLVLVLGLAKAQVSVPSPNQFAVEIPPTPTYLVLVPRKMRQEQELRISTTVFRLMYESLTFRISIRQLMGLDREMEVAFAEETFFRVGSRTVNVKIPPSISVGKYFIHVEGSVASRGGLLFSNRTEIVFEPKKFSVFIQLSRPIYQMGDIIKFRVLPFESNLLQISRTFTSIEVVDSENMTARRWLSPITGAQGFVELNFTLPATSNFGSWKIRCSYDSTLAEKSFLVNYNTQRSMISVNVSMPQRLSEYAFGVYGFVEANHTTNTPVKGNATLRLQIWPRNQDNLQQPIGVMWKTVPFFEGRSEFLFSMPEIQEQLRVSSRPSDMTVRVDAYVQDWYYLVNETSFAYSVIFSEAPDIRFLSGRIAQFKPGFPFTALMLIFQPNGQHSNLNTRKVSLNIFCNRNRLVQSETSIPIPDDSIVRVTFMTDPSCLTYRLNAQLSLQGADVRLADQILYKHYSASGSYMRVVSLTDNPVVDSYMVFNVRTSYYSPQIQYLLLASGNILHSDILNMPSGVMSKTFSIAVSRDMAPVARIVVFFMRQDGELVTDSLTFSVNMMGVNSVKVELTEGADLTAKTVTGWLSGASAGSFALLSALPYDLFVRYGSSVILQPNTILDELRTYEAHAEQPLRFSWFNDSSDAPFMRHYPNPTLGPDANKTMNYSGLIMFTDSNYTKVTFWHTCNETLDPSRAFTCYDQATDQCYSRQQQCDGNLDCNTGIDEMNCNQENESSLPGYVKQQFQFEFRHFDYDDDWLWQSIYMKPFQDGRVPFHPAAVPKLETAWVIGAVVVDKENGLRVQESPTVFSSRRQLYMQLEAPTSAIWGEQIGVRVAVFNRWDYWTEVIVEMKKSPDTEFIKVGAFGQVNSYSPETAANVAAHTTVFLPAGSQRTVYFPVLPRKLGDNVVTFCAYAFNGGECSTATVSVSMNGIANSYHSPILLDLVSQSQLQAQRFHILPEQTFVEPERRWRRYVPGSKSATFTVVGDIVGPTFSPDMPVGDSSSIVWKPGGSAESILFNINWNVQMLHYLRMTSQEQPGHLEKALRFVNGQLSRLSFYINSHNGGIANFPERFIYETSSFLTAFGLWTLAETAFPQWDRVVSVQADLFEGMLKYLASKQVSDGDPNYIGSFIDDIKWDMKYYDIYNEDNRTFGGDSEILARVPTTALVLLGAEHSRIPKQLKGLVTNIAAPAKKFLVKHLDKMTYYPFGLAMTALALANSNDQAKFQAISKLRSTARTDNYMYWANRRVRKLIREPDSAGRFLIKPRVEWPNDALSVQATSAALLAMYKVGNTGEEAELQRNITRMLNFILETKNTPNGWISTQDTIFAIRALREVAQLDLNRNIYQLRVSIVPSADTSQAATFTLSGSNLSIPQTVTFSNDAVWGDVTVEAVGSGRAVLQLNAQKSVENAFQVKNAADPLDPSGSLQTFEMSCVPEFSGRNASIIRMTTCAKWVWTDRSPTSGMAVMSYTVPTGYKLTNFYLRNYVQRSNVRGLRWAAMDGNTMNIIFTNLTSTESTCISFDFPRWYPVANITIEQSCAVYEYFENDNGNFTIYSARTLFTNDICDVCGSFQCPYCPDFNSAVTSLISSGYCVLPLLLMLTALLNFN